MRVLKKSPSDVVVSPGQLFIVVLNLWRNQAAQNIHQGNWNNMFSIIYTHGMGNRCKNNLKQHPSLTYCSTWRLHYEKSSRSHRSGNKLQSCPLGRKSVVIYSKHGCYLQSTEPLHSKTVSSVRNVANSVPLLIYSQHQAYSLTHGEYSVHVTERMKINS